MRNVLWSILWANPVVGLFMLLSSCSSSSPLEEAKKGLEAIGEWNSNEARTYVLQPLGEFPPERAQWIAKRLKDEGCNAIILPSVPLPRKAMVRTGSGYRYRADTLLQYLNALRGQDTLTLALTTCDISHSNKKSKDYGIMGLGSSGLESAVVSTFRVKGQHKWDKMVKLCMHEIGHVKGLPHCKARACIMRDAEGKDHFDQLTGFCHSCRKTWAEDS